MSIITRAGRFRVLTAAGFYYYYYYYYLSSMSKFSIFFNFSHALFNGGFDCRPSYSGQKAPSLKIERSSLSRIVSYFSFQDYYPPPPLQIIYCKNKTATARFLFSMRAAAILFVFRFATQLQQGHRVCGTICLWTFVMK